MKLTSFFSSSNAVTKLNASFPNLFINPDTFSPLTISSSAESCSSFSTGCVLGQISYNLCTCIQWLRMLISAFHVLPTVCTMSHDIQSGCVLSHWLLYLASMYLFCTLMAVTVLIFPLDSSGAVDICMRFPRVGDISLDIFSCKLKSHVSQTMLFLIRGSFLSPELHVDTRVLHCVTYISKLPSSSWFQVKKKYFPHHHPKPNACTQYLSA